MKNKILDVIAYVFPVLFTIFLLFFCPIMFFVDSWNLKQFINDIMFTCAMIAFVCLMAWSIDKGCDAEIKKKGYLEE